ncbi:hypothetical protein ANANG_G00120690 [Anguilla anguilla]|uniref:Uncharacterized protein n=1 Tax=Anguilla anguilla TaxID=7936 RepID=A0A9D3MDE6_ANGAN|nr:hypothetical protein ANANG_G00120690 [Anguilla anguilla]
MNATTSPGANGNPPAALGARRRRVAGASSRRGAAAASSTTRCRHRRRQVATLSLHDRKERHHEKDHKRNHSMGHISSKSSDRLNLLAKGKTDPAKTLGTALCPRMEDVPLLEPLICKKIAHERLTVLIFLEDCIVTACQEGFICTWARPGKVGLLSSQNQANSPSGTVV